MNYYNCKTGYCERSWYNFCSEWREWFLWCLHCTIGPICLRMGVQTNSEKRKMIPLHFVLIPESSKIRKKVIGKCKELSNWLILNMNQWR